MEKQKEKLEYLEHEDVGTMEKKITEFRIEEAEEELKRIASLKDKEAKSKSPEVVLKTREESQDGIRDNLSSTYKKPTLCQKILVRICYTFIILGIAVLIYYLNNN